jgi:hypothetical protein
MCLRNVGNTAYEQRRATHSEAPLGANCGDLNSPEPHPGRLFWCHPVEAELRYGVVADVADGVLWTDYDRWV